MDEGGRAIFHQKAAKGSFGCHSGQRVGETSCSQQNMIVLLDVDVIGSEMSPVVPDEEDLVDVARVRPMAMKVCVQGLPEHPVAFSQARFIPRGRDQVQRVASIVLHEAKRDVKGTL